MQQDLDKIFSLIDSGNAPVPPAIVSEHVFKVGDGAFDSGGLVKYPDVVHLVVPRDDVVHVATVLLTTLCTSSQDLAHCEIPLQGKLHLNGKSAD